MTKYMDVGEFRQKGYLHELNRQFLHPLGLALEIRIDDLGNETIGGIWDYRDDPEGMEYSPETLSPDKARYITSVIAARCQARVDALGYWVQPVEGDVSQDDA